MTIEINKKSTIGVICVIALIALGYLAYGSFTTSKYEEHASAMKRDVAVNFYLSTYSSGIISDYWRKSIGGGYVEDENGESHYVNDINEACQYAVQKLTAEGIYLFMDSVSKDLDSHMAEMKYAPSKYKDVNEKLFTLYSNLKELTKLAGGAQLNIMQYNERANDLMSKVSSGMSETDLYFKVDNDSIQRYCVQQIVEFKKKKYESYIKAQETYIKKYSSLPGVKSISSPKGTLYYKIIKSGSPESAVCSEEDMITAHYEGKDIEGIVFDNSYKRGQPAQMRVNQVIPGWTLALTHMRAGDTWEVVIPASLAYEGRAAGNIKPYSTLIFKIDLLKVEKE